MRTFENFRKVINESDYILSEAQRYLEILLEKDSEALKQYKASQKSFKKGFGKNIKPTVVQPGLDLYKAGGPFVPDKTTFKDTGKKVPRMEPKPQFGKPKNKNKAPDRTGLKKAISDVRASDKRLYDAGVGKKPSLVQQRKYTLAKIKELSRQTTLKDKLYGSTGSTEGAGGANTGTKPQKSASASEYTKKINQANPNRPESKVNKSGYSQTNKPKAGSEPTLFKRVKPNAVNAQVVGSTPFDSKSGVKSKGTRTISTTVPQKGKELKPRVITKTRKVKSSIFNPPDYGTPSYYKRQGKDAFDLKKNPITKSTSKGPQLPKFLNTRTGFINKTKTKGAIDLSKLSQPSRQFAYSGSALVKKSPKILKPATDALVKVGTKLGKTGRLGLLAGTVTAVASPGGRRFIRNAALGTLGALGLAQANKKEKKLKLGDGLTVPKELQGRMKMGSTNKTMGKNEVRVNYSASGIQRNQSDIDRIKKAQKNFIDKYNKGRMFNKIKYNVNKKGTYDIIKPKKK